MFYGEERLQDAVNEACIAVVNKTISCRGREKGEIRCVGVVGSLGVGRW